MATVGNCRQAILFFILGMGRDMASMVAAFYRTEITGGQEERRYGWSRSTRQEPASQEGAHITFKYDFRERNRGPGL